MDLKKLDSSFYIDNPVLVQAMDFDMQANAWFSRDKVRGHGIVQIQVNELTFAIPVRSNISHDECFILEVNRDDNRIKGMGLDYSKAVLIRNRAHVSSENFVLKSKHAGKKLIGKEVHIQKRFSRYVERYIAAIKKNDTRILNSKEYRHTTLINYHHDLGID
jgi:protein AbiQ